MLRDGLSLLGRREVGPVRQGVGDVVMLAGDPLDINVAAHHLLPHALNFLICDGC